MFSGTADEKTHESNNELKDEYDADDMVMGGWGETIPVMAGGVGRCFWSPQRLLDEMMDDEEDMEENSVERLV